MSLSEALAYTDVVPSDPTDSRGVVEDVHVRAAANLMCGLVGDPRLYAQIGAHEFFISFAQQQQSDVEGFVTNLKAASYTCFIADESIPYSTRWAEEIWHAVRVCRCFLPLVTADWLNSSWCAYELGAAFALSKRIVPILVGDVDPSPPVAEINGIRVHQASDLKDLAHTDRKRWDRILAELRRLSYREAT